MTTVEGECLQDRLNECAIAENSIHFFLSRNDNL